MLRVGLEQQGQADGGKIMVTPEIWDTVALSSSCMLIKLDDTKLYNFYTVGK